MNLRNPTITVFPKNPAVGDYYTSVQGVSVVHYVYDGCVWLLMASAPYHYSPDTIKDDPIEAYDHAMGVI